MKASQLDRSLRTAEINTWRPRNEKEVIVESKDQIFTIHFEKFFPKKMAKYDDFIVKKSSFEKYLNLTAGYINYFMNRYDPENELLTAYLKIKWLLDPQEDRESCFTAENPQALIDLIYELIFTKSICDKICRMVEDNYLDDIEKDASKYKSASNSDYKESLEFTNQHNKILLRISIGMKIICPIMYHYFMLNHIKPKSVGERKDISLVYDFYQPLFKLFQDDVDMFNKLYVYVKRKVMDSWYHNQKIFQQRDIYGDDLVLVVERFVKTRIIVDNMVKYKFNQNWDPKKNKYEENIIGLHKTILKYQLNYFIKETYGKTPTEMTNTKDSEGLSASDKMEMNLAKRDIGIVHMAEENVRTTCDRLEKQIDVPITEEEIEYYREHHTPSPLQVNLVRSYYAKYFQSYRDENLLTRKQYIRMMLMLKKKLLLDDGFEKGDRTIGQCFLPHIICGNIDGEVVTKQIRNKELMSKIQDNPEYQRLKNEKYRELEEASPVLDNLTAKFLKTKFNFVSFEEPELTGDPIEINDETVCDELIRLYSVI